MNFEGTFRPECGTPNHDERRDQRIRDLVASALWLCGHRSSIENVEIVLEDLHGRYGEDADVKIVSALNAEYFTAFFKRKLDEKNREEFADELAARVWDTVKHMTWYTDGQKVVPEDLAERVARKAKTEADELDALRRKLCG